MADNKINVTVSANTRKNITVSSAQQSTEITASTDTGRFWAQTSKNWAISDVIVDNTDYSSKHYAQEAKTSAQNASNYEVSTRESYNSFLETSANAVTEIQGAKEETLTEIDNSKTNAVDSINTVKNSAIDSINSTKTTILQDIEFVADGEKKEIEELSEETQNKIIDLGIDTRANVNLSNLSEDGEKHFLNKSQITNCLLEVPQNIKLELNDGVLTLKAGSKVIVPNGFEEDGTTLKFDEVVTTKDLGVSSGTGQKILMVTSDGNNISTVSLSKSCSGATDSLSGETYHAWYDTNNNIIKRYGTDTSTPTSIVSFPIVIATFTDETHCTVDHVFNGFGYIGSTIWVDKGVKGLAPNGFNNDGTLNNKVIEYKNIYTRTFTTSSSSPLWFGIQENVVTDIVTSNYKHNEKENRVQKISTGTFISPTILAGTYNRGENGVIYNFQPKLPFRAVDYNEFNTLNNNALLDSDKSEISGWGMPSNKYIDLTLGASGTTYTAPANGWFHISKGVTATNQYVNLRNTTTEVIIEVRGPANNTVCACYIPAKKGDVVACTYSANGTVKSFRFTYAEGEV